MRTSLLVSVEDASGFGTRALSTTVTAQDRRRSSTAAVMPKIPPPTINALRMVLPAGIMLGHHLLKDLWGPRRPRVSRRQLRRMHRSSYRQIMNSYESDTVSRKGAGGRQLLTEPGI